MLSAANAILLSTPFCKLAFMGRDKEAEKEAEAGARAGFARRLAGAFQRANRLQPNGKPDRAWLAEQIGISVQYVGQALDPEKPNVFSAYTTARAARALGVNPHWLATGEETPEPPRLAQPLVAPQAPADMGTFVGQLVDLFTQLDADARDDLLDYANKLAAGPNRRWRHEDVDKERRALGGIRGGDFAVKRAYGNGNGGQSLGVAAVVLGPRGRFYIEVTGAANRNPTFACGAVNALRRALERLMEEGP